MGLFGDIFLSKQDKHVVDIYNEIMNYWKTTNDFYWAHNQYFSRLNNKYHWGFSEKIVTIGTNVILTSLLEKELSQDNTIFIFSQFIVFYIFRNDKSGTYRYSEETLILIAENILDLLVPYNSRVTPEFSHQLNKDFDIHMLHDEGYLESKAPDRSQSNWNFSINKLASRIGCSPDLLKQAVFEQLDNMGATIESCNDVMLRHNKTRFEQAVQYDMHPDDTPAAIMIKFTEEYVTRLKTLRKSDDQILSDLANSNTDLMADLLTAKATGNMDRFNQLIKQNPEFLDKFLEMMAENEEKEIDDENEIDLPY